MDRRNFFKLVGTVSGAAVTGSCGKSAREIIPLLVPAQEIVPGVEEWHPSVCRACGAGCGTIVRVMEAERRNGDVRERIAAIKKIEGNPLDPVSGGRLCARGQAAVQSLYHPDRLRGPLKQGRPVSWEQALNEIAARLAKADPGRIVFIARPEASTRSATIAAFLKALGAAPAITPGLGDFTIERAAAGRAFGWNGLPVYDLAGADYVLGLGADFLGTWASPVYYARQFGHMRQGRAGRRGRLVHAESRFSTTAAAADEWLPVRPGGEQALALAVGKAVAEDKKAGPAALRDAFASVDFDRAAQESGVAPERIRRVAHELANAEAPLALAGASIVHRRSLDAVVTGNALNWLLGSVGSRVLAPAPPPFEAPRADRPGEAEVVFLDANPVYARPSWRLERVPLVVSFSQFLDDSSAHAHYILPDHDPLESSVAVAPAVAPGIALTGAASFVRPLYDTRATEHVLADLAARLGKQFEADSPERAFARAQADVEESMRQGGYWPDIARRPQAKPPDALPPLAAAEFDGDPKQFPYEFQPYPTLQFGDGCSAHLPWLQELPDPASSAMWGLPVEIDVKTAARLGVVNGDLLRVVSPHGEITAPAYVHPAALPGVVSMGIGQGHASYTRFASGRGANPLAIAGNAGENGAFVFAAARVRIERAGARGGLVQFSYMDRQPETARR